MVCDQARVISQQRNELENFAYALAHDFKQPIRQIITFSELISSALCIDEIKQHLSYLSTAAERLGKLVDVMTQYTLLNQPPELSDVDLNTVFSAVRDSLGYFMAEHGGELILSSPAPVLRANETLMIQVVQNLIVNGMLYNRSAHPTVEVSFERDGDKWIVNIRDDGIGINSQYLADIFMPLIRLHNASEFPGSGLGLTLARKAILAQDGAIWCESVPGCGSVFHIRLHAADSVY
jgi:light-regulated signal transduction histidine kinase (bacteriophytochrome)